MSDERDAGDVGSAAPSPGRDPWVALAALTPARVALGRTGASLPTARHLELQLAHARARDAVWHPLDAATLAAALGTACGDDAPPVVRVHSSARDRREFLERPDRGRRLDEAGRATLARHAGAWDLAIVVADGLAALAATRHAPPLVEAVCRRLADSRGEGWRIAPLVVAEQARVALGDEIGEALGARLVVVMLGERPGMSAPDSLGVYLTWEPRPGRTDAERNCVSNVRAEGLPPAAAAEVVVWLLRAARRLGQSGVALRAPSPAELAIAALGEAP